MTVLSGTRGGCAGYGRPDSGHRGRWRQGRAMAGRRQPEDGFTFQAFRFALDPTPAQVGMFFRFSGSRRKAHNWAVEQMQANIDAYRESGAESPYPSFFTMKKAWNAAKPEVCVNAETGVQWWPEIHARAFYGGVRDACDAYDRWSKSQRGLIGGRRVGFPRFKKRGRDRDRFSCGEQAKLAGRRHVRLPKIGTVRLWENARRLKRLTSLGRARILSATVSRHGKRWFVSLQVEVLRPQRHHKPADPGSRVGVDLGVRRLATVARPDGTVIERVANPKALDRDLHRLRQHYKARSRCVKGSRRWKERNRKISQLHARVADTRKHHLHVLTTRLAKTHGQVVIEDLDVAGMLAQKGIPAGNRRRRAIADAAMGETARQLHYKCGWYGSELIEADRHYPSSSTCSKCGHKGDDKQRTFWTCQRCGTRHDRDDNAAINLARWNPPQQPTPAAPTGGGPSAQSGLPTSAEPARRPRSPRQAATKRESPHQRATPRGVPSNAN